MIYTTRPGGGARFQIVSQTMTKDETGKTQNRITIKDLGPWTIHKTVTNDIEAVVFVLYHRGILKEGDSLCYYDSEGQLTGVLHKGNQFLGYVPATPDTPKNLET